jgi:hypothetical protein
MAVLWSIFQAAVKAFSNSVRGLNLVGFELMEDELWCRCFSYQWRAHSEADFGLHLS